jgi:glutamate-ammonia-ligase adenylyltransferase
MLRDSSGAAERLSIALSNSRLATSLLELIPEGAAWFEDPDSLKPTALNDLNEQSSSLASRHEDLDDFAKAVRHIRRRETLRLALGAVVGELSILEIASGLSDLSQWYLSTLTSAIKVFMEQGDESSIDFGIVAMGRFGGQELGFGSDADLMFVYRSVEASESERSQKQAERIISELHRLVTDPQLEFQIDMDLRPEGKNGSVARSIESYRAYYSRWGDIWENQALLRARVIYGSEELVSEFNEVIDKYRYPEELAEKSVIEIRRIKARVETERLPQGADPKRHLKLGRGSLSDIEWLVQLLQLRHGSEHPEIRTPKTLDALDSLVECNLIEEHEAKVLRDAWILTSRVRSSGVLWSNKVSDVLALDRRQLEGMARILEYPRGSASALEEDYLAHTRRSRQVFERVFFA